MGLEVFHTFTALFKTKMLVPLSWSRYTFAYFLGKGGSGWSVPKKNFFNTPIPLFIINSLQRGCDFHFIIIWLLSKDSNRLWGSRVRTGGDGPPPTNPRSWPENPTTRFSPKKICYRILCKILALRSHH